MDFFELHAEFCVNVPAKGGAEQTGAEIVHSVFGVAEHDCEVFRDVLEEDVQGVHVFDDGFVF